MNNVKKEKKANILSFLNFEKIALVILAGTTILVLFYCVQAISFPYEIDYVEGLLIYYSQIPIDDLYNDLATGELISPVLYSPAAIVVFSFLQKIFSVSPFLLGRILSFVSILGVSLVVYWVVRKITKQNIPGIVAALWFLCFPVTVSMYPLFRVDQLGVFLALAGFFTFFLGSKKKSIRLVSIFLLALATFVKITFLLPGLAFLIILLLKKNKRNYWYIFIYIGLLLFLHGGMQIISNGAYIKNVFWYSMLNDYAVNRGLVYIQFIILFFTPFAYFLIREKRKLKAIAFPMLIYLGVAHLILLSIFRRGVNVNFFFEFTALWAMVVGIIYWLIKTKSYKFDSNKAKLVYKGVYYYFFLFSVIICALLLISGDINFVTSPKIEAAHQEIDEYVYQHDGIFLSERNGFLVTNRKGIILDTFQVSSVSKKLNYNQEKEIISLIQNREFTGIITKKGRSNILILDRPFSKDVLSIIEKYYTVSIDNENFSLFVPDY
jgi:hypothetical protein